MTGAIQVLLDSWPELIFAALSAAGLVVLSKLIGTRVRVRIERNPDDHDPRP